MKIKKSLFGFVFIFLIGIFGAFSVAFDIAYAVVQPPVLEISLTENSIVELDDENKLEIPQPSINFEYNDSIVYDEYKANGFVSDKTYVVRGIDSTGKSTFWSTNSSFVNDGKFIPNAIGQYEIQYTARIEVYNKNKFTYFEDGYYTNVDLGHDVKISIGENAEYRFENTETYIIVRQENGVAKFYRADSQFNQEEEIEQSHVTELDGFAEIDFEKWFEELRIFVLQSDIYRITVKDTIGPKIAEYDYSAQESMTVDDFKANGIEIYGIDATDASGIDFEKSEITLFYKRTNGMSGGEYVDVRNGTVYKSTSPNPEGIYTITYKVFDNNGNVETAIYVVRVGDTVAPVITLPENFVKDTINIQDGFSIDIADIEISDNVSTAEKCDLRVKLVETESEKEAKCNIEGTKYNFLLEKGKSYKFTITAYDEVGNCDIKEYYFDNVTINLTGDGEVNLSKVADLYLRGTKLNVSFEAKTGWKLDSFDGVTLDVDDCFEVGENTVLSVVFKPKAISLSDKQIGVELVSTMNIVAEGSSIEVKNVVEGNQHFSQLKNLLSNPDKLAIYDITLKDKEGQYMTQLSDKVTLRIKLDEKFDVNKISVFRVDLTGDLSGDKVRYNFTIDGDYIVLETDHFSYYTISQSEGFKPVSPSKDGTNKMGLTLIILGVAGLVAVAVIAGFVLVKKKKN